jgi:ankyrin repeat protein
MTMRPPSRTSLFAAAKIWDASQVKASLVAAPQLATAVDPRGRTALHLACAVKPGSSAELAEPNGLRTVEALLDAGAVLEAEVPMAEDEGDFRATPLWYAVARGENLPLVELLLRHGANASHSLWAAVWRDDDAVCRLLLEASPALNLQGTRRDAHLLCGEAQAVEDPGSSDRCWSGPLHRRSSRPRYRPYRARASLAERDHREARVLEASKHCIPRNSRPMLSMPGASSRMP